MTALAAKSWPYLICKVLTPSPDGLLAAGHVSTCSLVKADAKCPQQVPRPQSQEAEVSRVLPEADADSLRTSPISTRNAPRPPSLPTQGEECGGGCGRGGEREAGWRGGPASQHSPGLAPDRRLPAPIPRAWRSRSSRLGLQGRWDDRCEGMALQLLLRDPMAPGEAFAGPLPVEAWAGTPAGPSGTVGAEQRPWPVATSAPPAVAAQLCPVSWELSSTLLREAHGPVPQVVSSLGTGTVCPEHCRAGAHPGAHNGLWPHTATCSQPPVRGHGRWRGPAGHPEPQSPRVMGGEGRRAWGQTGPGQAHPPGGSLGLGKPLLLGKFRQLPRQAAGRALGWGLGSRPCHRPAARGLGPPSPLVYPRPPSGCHRSTERG